MPPKPRKRPPRPAGARNRNLLIAAAGAVAAVAVLVVVSIVVTGGGDNGSTTTTGGSSALFAGIPQQGTTLGAPGAPVTLVQFEDMQCPVCREYQEDGFSGVVDEYVRPGKVKVEFRGFPFIGDDSVKAYRFLLAAAEQDKLWNLQEALYRNQGDENSGWVTDDLVRRVAGEIPGLDVDKLVADASRPAIEQEAAGASKAASNAGITGTPTFLLEIGDQQPYRVTFGSLDQMRAALDDALPS